MFSEGDEVRYVGRSGQFDGVTGVVDAEESFEDGTQALRVTSDQLRHGFFIVSSTEVEHLTESTVDHEELMEEYFDPVNHPAHYTSNAFGIETIEITELENFCVGNALKYILRRKHKGNEVQDLRKAIWYLTREADRLEGR